MTIRYASGIRVEGLTIDPVDRVEVALWTHRPARRAPARRTLAAAPLADAWSQTLGLPLGSSAIAMGHRIELLPTGYGPGGAAVLLTRGGRRTLIVGPTTTALVPRRAERLVLFAPRPPTPPAEWLERARAATALDLLAPDGAGAAMISAALTIAGLPHRRPRWLGLGVGPRDAGLRVVTRGDGLLVDARPQADEAWLADFARRVAPRSIFVHGARGDALARRLAVAGHAVRVLHGPQQLALLDPDVPPPFVPPAPEWIDEVEEPDRR
ncbi:MAG: hypothetical protein H6701_09715 [Myxococcales bacterium]|nr:hypothetical protein [Myxococcales bacterium]MCB9551017.1 hypothetical protein [Myxococcales bacterium]